MLWGGVVLIVVLALIRKANVRRWSMTVAIILLTIAATEFLGREIVEKWRIRNEWTIAHENSLTARQTEIAIADGANLLLGPLIFGFQAFCTFIIVAAATALVRRFATGTRETELRRAAE